MSTPRNDPCKCGSGKKFKKCCLLKEYEQERIDDQEWEEWFKKDCDEGEKNLQEASNKS